MSSTLPPLRLALALGIGLSLLVTASDAQTLPSARLGRLFSSPGERSLLDGKRGSTPTLAQPDTNAQPGETPFAGGPTPDAAGAPAGPAPVTYNGLVRASNGHTTVWLDATPASNSAASRDGKALTLRLSSGRKLRMQPGQSYDALSGKVLEGTPAAPPTPPPPELKQ
jgi:hypothetical protein